MKKNLQEYFNSANRFLDSQNLMSQQQYQNLIESKPINPTGKIIKMSNKFIQRGVIMSIVGVAVLIGLYLGSGLFNAGEPSQKVNNITHVIAQTQSGTSEKIFPHNKSEEKLLRDDSQLNPPESFHNIVSIIRLNIDELKNLGFFKTDSGYALITETTIKEEIDPNKIKSLPYYGYNLADSSSTFKEKFTIDTFKSKMSIITFKESKSYGNILLNPITFNRHYKSKNGDYGFMSQGLSDANNIEKEAIRKVFQEMDRFKKQYIFQGKLENLKSDFVDISDSGYSYITKLIPIYFTIGNTKENGSENIIWYVASKNLINSLPERYKNILLDKINYVDRIKATQKDKVEYAPIKNVKEDINQTDTLKTVILSNEELGRIGIKYDGKNYSVITEEYKKNNKNLNNTDLSEIKIEYERHEIKSTDSGISTFSTVKFDDSILKSPLKIAPVAISSSSFLYKFIGKFKEYGKSSVIQHITMDRSPLLSVSDFNSKDLPKLTIQNNLKWLVDSKKLLPIKIITDTKPSTDSSNFRHTETVFWYVPTKEFIEALPDRYRNNIINELALLDKLENGTITEDKACETLKGKDSYFDICRLSSENIKNLTVYPNPIINSTFNIKFNLLKKAKLEFDLFDINGSHKAHLLSTTLEPGAIDIPHKLNAPIEDGIYIIIIKSEDGSQVSSRVILQNR